MSDYYVNRAAGYQPNQSTVVSAPNVFGTAGSNASNSPTIGNSANRAHTVANANFPEATDGKPSQSSWQNFVKASEGQATQTQATQTQATVHSR